MNGYKAGKPLETIQKHLFQHYYTVQVKLLSTNMVFTIKPENLRTIMASNFNDWILTTRRIRVMHASIGHGIFTTDGPIWKQSRELLTPNFARSQIDDPETLESHVSALIDAIPHDGSTVDLQEGFHRLTRSIAIEFLLGFNPSTSKETSTAFSEALHRLLTALNRGWYLGRLMKIFGASLKKDTKIVNDFLDHYIDLALKAREKYTEGRIQGERYVFLHEVVQRTQDPEWIRSEILHILLAGEDTTANLLSHTWFVLANRPDVWASLRAEVDNLNGEKPSFTALQEMKYLKAVLNESRVSRTTIRGISADFLLAIALRLYPVVPLAARMASADMVLPVGGGRDGRSPLFVQKGQVVSWSYHAMHRRKDIYGEDADEFGPERWQTLRPRWGYLPFAG